jgi:hypothetical protein
MAVVLRPAEPIRIPNSDVCLSVELRNRAHKSIGLTMVSAVAHVWFNTFFEGEGPELMAQEGGRPKDSGVFTIDWEAMDGIKGSSRKGARALDRVAVVWRVAGSAAREGGDVASSAQGGDGTGETPMAPATATQGEEIKEPLEGQPVPQAAAADWKGANDEDAGLERELGLRVNSPASADISKASSLRSVAVGGEDGDAKKQDGAPAADGSKAVETGDGDDHSLKGVRSSGPSGEELNGAGK